MKIGVLVHVYHLETVGWADMVWGDPTRNELGALTKLVECLLDIPAHDNVLAIIYSGPSSRDGLSEGEYTKKYLLDRLGKLTEFPRLKTRLDTLSPAEYEVFVERLRGLVAGPTIKNTAVELEAAAEYFATEGADRVLQICAATHAPRCLRNQLSLRYHGLIAPSQVWVVMPGDVGYRGITPDDIVIAEPIHRRDNPLYGFHPSWAELTKLYPRLSLENKKLLLHSMDATIQAALAEQPETTEVAN